VDDDDDGSEGYITVEKPRALSSTSDLPPHKPSLPSRYKSASMSNLPPTAPSGPHSRAMEARKRRTNSGTASPNGIDSGSVSSRTSLFTGWKAVLFNRQREKDASGAAGKGVVVDVTQTKAHASDSGGTDSDELPSPTPAPAFVKPPPTPSPPPAPSASSSHSENFVSCSPDNDNNDDSSATAPHRAPRIGPIFKRESPGSGTTSRESPKGRGSAMYPRKGGGGGGEDGGLSR